MALAVFGEDLDAMIARLRAIMPEVLVDLPLPYRNPQHRELFLSGLRVAMGGTSIGIDRHPRNLSRTGA